MKKNLAFFALFLVFVRVGLFFAQLAPPTTTKKVRHQQSVALAWNYAPDSEWELLYFSIKVTPDLNIPVVELKQVPKTVTATSIVAEFSVQYPKYLYLIVTGIYNGPTHESLNSNTIALERIGPRPSP